MLNIPQKCFGPTERRFAGYEEQLDCNIYSINYEKRLQGLINANDTKIMFCIDEYFHDLQAGNCHF